MDLILYGVQSVLSSLWAGLNRQGFIVNVGQNPLFPYTGQSITPEQILASEIAFCSTELVYIKTEFKLLSAYQKNTLLNRPRKG
jgi:hypothetical protein